MSPKNTVENLQRSKEQRKELEKIGVENLESYKIALNSIATTEHGSYFLRCLIRGLGVYKPINTKSPVDDIVQRNVYLEKIRPFLTKKVRRELENE